MKSRGLIKLSYNDLSTLLNLKENSIRKVFEKDQGDEELYILHDDVDCSIDYTDFSKIVEKKFNKHLNKTSLIKDLILSGLEIDPSDVIQYIFGLELYPKQKKIINRCLLTFPSTKFNHFDRGEGATVCSIFEAIFLSLFCDKKVTFVVDTDAERMFLINNFLKYLENIEYNYCKLTNEIKFGKGIIHFQISRFIDSRFFSIKADNLIGDNLKNNMDIIGKTKLGCVISFYNT